jgi:hypothetical protein
VEWWQSGVTELVLAFDASCARCRAVAAAVAGSGLEVLPLRDYRVVDWCAEAGAAGGAPTLLEITPTAGDDRVRAWTGAGLVRRLVRRLGPRRALRVVAALRAHGVLGDAVTGVLGKPLRRPSPARGA